MEFEDRNDPGRSVPWRAHPSTIPDIRVRELKVLRALAEHESFSAAAIALRVSQPKISTALKRLEQRVGAVLFERDTRSVRITPAGRVLVDLADRLLNDMAGMVTSMRRNSVPEKRIIRVGLSPVAGCTTIAARLAGAFARAVDNELGGVSFVEVADDLVEDEVAAGRIDIGLSCIRRKNSTLQIWESVVEPLVLCIPDSSSTTGNGATLAFDGRRLLTPLPTAVARSLVRAAAFSDWESVDIVTVPSLDILTLQLRTKTAVGLITQTQATSLPEDILKVPSRADSKLDVTLSLSTRPVGALPEDLRALLGGLTSRHTPTPAPKFVPQVTDRSRVPSKRAV